MMDYISSNSYKGICCREWETTHDDVPAPGVIHVDMMSAPEFFKRHGDNERNYILVSSSNDIGLALQGNNPVWADYNKGIDMIPPVEFIKVRDYVDFPAVARCDRSQCNFADRYSLRCYAYTFKTFNFIPLNIKHWFMTNPMLEDPRVSAIPLGIFGDPEGRVARTIAESPKKPYADKLLYINFQNYTRERAELKQYFHRAGYKVYLEPTLSFEDHLKEVDNHWFTLCPNGNGIDCHRLYEVLYMGKIPIIQESILAKQLEGLPMLVLPDLRMVYPELLHRKSAEIMGHGASKYSLEKATLSYWRNKINESKNLL